VSSESTRRIIHIDMDAFYASVEQRDDPGLRGKPLAVGGSPQSRGVVAAASYEARKFGVRSAMPMARAVRLCPHLEIVRPDFARYRAASQQVMAILRIREDVGITASAGVAPNKFLAKIASGWQKPDGLTVISPDRVEAFLAGLPVDALWGVGPVTADKLRKLGISKLTDVRAADMTVLRRTVGSQADWLRRLSFGDDPRQVQPNRPWKSISSETTYDEDLVDLREVRAETERLARRAAASLAKKNLVARCVTIKVRYADFTTVTRSHTADYSTSDDRDIAARAVALLARTRAGKTPVRLLGAGVHELSEGTRAVPETLPLELLSR
jgi:DNA polymerase-4